LKNHEEISQCLKENVLLDYYMRIRCKVMIKKEAALKKFMNRHDHQMILVTKNKEKESIGELMAQFFSKNKFDAK
jgi:predicted solute-binding protein